MRQGRRLVARLAVGAVGALLIVAVAAFVGGRQREERGADTAAPIEISGCAKRVVDDWYADGRVDGAYAPRCYDAALVALDAVRAADPLSEVGSAQETIRHARHAAITP